MERPLQYAKYIRNVDHAPLLLKVPSKFSKTSAGGVIPVVADPVPHPKTVFTEAVVTPRMTNDPGLVEACLTIVRRFAYRTTHQLSEPKEEKDVLVNMERGRGGEKDGLSRSILVFVPYQFELFHFWSTSVDHALETSTSLSPSTPQGRSEITLGP